MLLLIWWTSASTVGVAQIDFKTVEISNPWNDILDELYHRDAVYVQNESIRFQTFIANRLALIHDASSSTQWRYVPPESNPADYSSRGLKANESKQLDQWLNGPSFLWKNERHWPTQPTNLPGLSDNDKELKKKSFCQPWTSRVFLDDAVFELAPHSHHWVLVSSL